jgi:hypothetical protein
MRYLTGIVAAMAMLIGAIGAQAVPTRGPVASTPQAILAWMNIYHTQPDPSALPAAVKALSQAGALREPEQAGVYVGFVAGVLGSNPNRADELIDKMLPLPGEDQWMLVRAVAYSGLPNWKTLLREFADRLPSRRAMIDKYVRSCAGEKADRVRETAALFLARAAR